MNYDAILVISFGKPEHPEDVSRNLPGATRGLSLSLISICWFSNFLLSR